MSNNINAEGTHACSECADIIRLLTGISLPNECLSCNEEFPWQGADGHQTATAKVAEPLEEGQLLKLVAYPLDKDETPGGVASVSADEGDTIQILAPDGRFASPTRGGSE